MRVLLFLFVLFFPFYIGLAHEEESAVLIAITRDGFEPSNITIEPHTKVVFINRDDVGHWPASDRHPTHSDFAGTDLEVHCSENYKGNPSFDSCRAIEAGETWSFIFEDSGTFHYHDHVWSHLGGTIIVEEERQRLRIEVWISSFIEWVKSFFEFDTDEFQNELVNITNTKDPKEAIKILEEETFTNDAVSAVCHDLVHEIGRAAYKKYKILGDATSYQNDFCNSGYIHGVFEQYFTDNEIEPEEIKDLCKNLPRLFDLWQCYHGIGHGLMYKTGGDLTQSLEICASSLDPSPASICQNGVYMELFNSEILLHEASFINSEKPIMTCDSMMMNQNDCYIYAPTYLTQNLNWSHEETMDMCLALDEKTKLSCINGVAAEAAKRNQNNPGEAFSLCEQFESRVELNECIEGASGITVFQTASIEESKTACESAGNFVERCKTEVEKMKPLFTNLY